MNNSNEEEFLLCKPDFWSVEYDINIWMDKSKESCNKTAIIEWTKLYNAFTELNVTIKLLDPVTGLPDLTYVDCGLLIKNIFIPSNFYNEERQVEKDINIQWFKNNNYNIKKIDQNISFEGHGDSLWFGPKYLFIGHGFRTNYKAYEKITAIMDENFKEYNINIIPIQLTDLRWYHLDTCFCPLDYTNDNKLNSALIYREAILPESFNIIKSLVNNLIEIPLEDALNFACNSVVIGKNIIIPKGSQKTCSILKDIGFNPIEIPMNEMMKGGGACKCLSFPLKTKIGGIL